MQHDGDLNHSPPKCRADRGLGKGDDDVYD